MFEESDTDERAEAHANQMKYQMRFNCSYSRIIIYNHASAMLDSASAIGSSDESSIRCGPSWEAPNNICDHLAVNMIFFSSPLSPLAFRFSFQC